MKRALVLSTLLAATAPAAMARAADLPCGPAEKGTINLDGLTDDWSEVEGLDAGGKDLNLSFTLKCNVEERTVMLLIDVRDSYFVRTKAAKPGEDHLELTLAGHRLTIFPGDARAIPTLARWGSKPAKNIKAVSALQQNGWAVELAVPMSAIPGYKVGMPLAYKLQAADCDSKAALKTERTVESAGSIVFAEGDAALEGFLKDRNLKRSDIWFDKGISLGGKSGGRVVLAGRLLAFITDGYVFIELPVKQRADVKEARLADLAGDGRQAILMRYVERGAGGTRDVLAAWRVVGDSEIRRVFAVEVGKQGAAGRIDDKVAFVKRGRATDIVIDAGAAGGVSAATWKESPAEDMIPVMLPWADDRHARYQFSGDEYKRAQ
ncbi:MAG: hypothetical protein JWM53_1418 [bacterium]|nr:hypothetical protein [bacterium]